MSASIIERVPNDMHNLFLYLSLILWVCDSNQVAHREDSCSVVAGREGRGVRESESWSGFAGLQKPWLNVIKKIWVKEV